MTPSDLDALVGCVDSPSRVLTQAQTVQRLSRDFYWYSPVLKRLLDDKTAEAVIQPISTEEVVAVLGTCYERRIPVTARGAGTGNYGQAIPLQGGVVLDLSLMDTIHEINADGIATIDPGTRLGSLETAARALGWELRCYPSTLAKASIGGFLGGGSGGIGSVTHGGLRDFQTVRALEVVTMEKMPRVVQHEGEAVHDILHAWGTNGIITKIWLALTPAVEWSQAVVTFPDFDQAFTFSEQVATEDKWQKRLVTTFEWPIPAAFTPISQYLRASQSTIFFMIASSQLQALQEAAEANGGDVTLTNPYVGPRTQPLLSDYTWNHTTLWYMKHDPAFTYLQCGFSLTEARTQFVQLKARYGDDFLFHIEFMKQASGRVVPGSIPVVRFTTEERLNDMIDFCRSIGVFVANPHSNNVEGGGRYREDNVQLLTKYKYDPLGLLNPGKMATFHHGEAPAPH